MQRGEHNHDPFYKEHAMTFARPVPLTRKIIEAYLEITYDRPQAEGIKTQSVGYVLKVLCHMFHRNDEIIDQNTNRNLMIDI